MNEITYQKSYQEYKEELKTELNRTVESFVRIGYLLKVARDTDILLQSEYDNVVDFAKAEYGIDKTQVSRFIHINDKFSEGGYSDHLIPEYQGYGYAKLTIMLQLPEAINEELSPQYSKSEIQTIKEELDEENKISDIEVMLEQPADGESIIEKVIMQLAEDEPDLYIAMHGIFERCEGIEAVKEQMVPSGIKTYIVRVKGTGRMMLMLNEDAEVKIVNARSGEKTESTWQEMMDAWRKIMQEDTDPKETWEKMFCRQFPSEKKQPVAPVQQQKKESKVTKAKKPEKKKPEKPINTESEVEKKDAENEIEPEKREIEPEKREIEPEKQENGQIVPEMSEEEAAGEKNEEVEEQQEAAVIEEPEKVTGEIVENVSFTESGGNERIRMLKKSIWEDIEKMSEQAEKEMWAGMQLTVTDIELQLRQIMALQMGAGEA